MTFRAIVSDDGGDVGRRGIGPHWVAPIDLPLSLLVMAFRAIASGDGGDVGRRGIGPPVVGLRDRGGPWTLRFRFYS